MLLENKIALITGGASGMGRGIAYKFAEEGCTVAVADIDIKGANDTISEIAKRGKKGLALQCDVTVASQVKATVDKVMEQFSKIDILVNNAGGAHNMPQIEDLSEEQWHKVMNLNLTSHFLFCKYVVGQMKARKYGKIIGISSIGAIQPPGHVIAYNTAKAAIIGFNTDLATAVAPFNINVNTILPGPVRTNFYKEMVEKVPDKDAFFGFLGTKTPLGRVGMPEDIGNAAVFLASEMSSFITGQSLLVSGGLPLVPPPPKPQPKF
jgi:3-oxoacyl-[acyl-carrier protein] reductase